MVRFLPVIRALANENVEFVVIGGLAAVVHGASYVTDDLDICYARTQTNIEKIVRALAPFNPTLRGAPDSLPFLFDARTIHAGLNFTFRTSAGSVDLLGEVAGLGSFDQVLAESRIGRLEEVTCPIVTLEGLIKAKRAAGRHKDQMHLMELESIAALRSQQSKQVKPSP